MKCKGGQTPAEYSNGRKGELKRATLLLKTVIWSMPEPYEVNEEGKGNPLNPRGVVLLKALRERLSKLSTDTVLNVFGLSKTLLKVAEIDRYPSGRTFSRLEERVGSRYWNELNRRILLLFGSFKRLNAAFIFQFLELSGIRRNGSIPSPWEESLLPISEPRISKRGLPV